MHGMGHDAAASCIRGVACGACRSGRSDSAESAMKPGTLARVYVLRCYHCEQLVVLGHAVSLRHAIVAAMEMRWTRSTQPHGGWSCSQCSRNHDEVAGQ